MCDVEQVNRRGNKWRIKAEQTAIKDNSLTSSDSSSDDSESEVLLYEWKKEIVVEMTGSLNGVAVESGAQRSEALFLGEWLRAFGSKVMPSSSRCRQSVPSKVRNAFTQLHSFASH